MTNVLQFSDDEVIACKLPEPALAQRKQEVTQEIFTAVVAVNELDDGYEFRFPGDNIWANKLFEFIMIERECCPFVRFEFVFLPNQEAILLRLTGGAGVKTFLHEMVGKQSSK